MAGVRRNLFGSVYLTGANLVSQLALVPVFLHYWGAPTYGLWLVLFTIPAFFTFSDAGLSNTVGNAVTLALEQGQPRDAEAKLNAAWKFQGLAWAALFAVFCLLLAVCPLQRWLAVEALPFGEFAPAVALLCLYSLASLQAGVLAAVYRGARRYPAYLAWSGHARVLETALVATTLALGGRFAAVAGMMFAARLAGAAVLFFRGRRLLPEVHLAFFAGRWSDLKPLLPSGLAFLSFPVANALVNQGTVLVVNHLAGAPAVVLLSVCRQLARVFQQGTSVLLTSLHPEMTQACGREDSARIRQLQSLALVVPLLVALPYVLGMVAFGSGVIAWWTRKDLGVTWPLLLSCGVEAVSFGCTTLCALVPWATNRVQGLSVVYAAANGGALVLGAVGLGLFGMPVVPAAFTLGNVVFCAAGLRLGSMLGHFSIASLFAPKPLLQAAGAAVARRRLLAVP